MLDASTENTLAAEGVNDARKGSTPKRASVARTCWALISLLCVALLLWDKGAALAHKVSQVGMEPYERDWADVWDLFDAQGRAVQCDVFGEDPHSYYEIQTDGPIIFFPGKPTFTQFQTLMEDLCLTEGSPVRYTQAATPKVAPSTPLASHTPESTPTPTTTRTTQTPRPAVAPPRASQPTPTPTPTYVAHPHTPPPNDPNRFPWTDYPYAVGDGPDGVACRNYRDDPIDLGYNQLLFNIDYANRGGYDGDPTGITGWNSPTYQEWLDAMAEACS